MAHEEQSDGTGISRRKLIVTSATLAAAGVAVGAAGASVVSSAGGAAVASTDSGNPGEGEPVMGYLQYRESGQFEVYIGDRHSAFADRGMAAQVIDAANRAE